MLESWTGLGFKGCALQLSEKNNKWLVYVRFSLAQGHVAINGHNIHEIYLVQISNKEIDGEVFVQAT